MKSLFLSYFLFCFTLFSQGLSAANAADIQYIVLLRADGPLGADLDDYWDDILNVDKDLCHQAIKQYPPHCTITGFFHPAHSADYYLNAIQQAIINIGGIPSVDVNPSIQHGKTLDYIELTSTYISDFGDEFVSLVGLPHTLVKGPPGFGFHITLRDKTFKPTLNRLKRIRALQKQFINPSDPAGWLIYLYIRKNDVLTPYLKPIRIIPVP